MNDNSCSASWAVNYLLGKVFNTDNDFATSININNRSDTSKKTL